MDLVKIGKYIAGKRKNLGLTQKQLAEKLGMSDKSVSKWERGVCLPDVSLYFDLCSLLGISVNEFLAGEDIIHENLEKKSEENIISVVTDSKRKQKSLKYIICALLILSILTTAVIATFLYRAYKPMNFITPMDENSVEMQTVNLIAGPDGANAYQFTTTDRYSGIKIYYAEYHQGKLLNKEPIEIGFEDMDSPKNGGIIIVPDYDHAVIKLVVWTDAEAKASINLPLMEGVEGREYYIRSQVRIEGKPEIIYDFEEVLLGWVYTKDEVNVSNLHDLLSGKTDAFSENEYIYLFSYEFCKK
nr:helix-turn-helix transcriptional regulator [uncultured Oribacterium sp.]